MDKQKLAISLAVAVSLLVGGAAYALRLKQPVANVVIEFEQLPLRFDRYSGTVERFSQEVEDALGADTTMLRRYQDKSRFPVYFYAAYFGEQTYGKQIHSPRQCLPGGGWRILSHEKIPIEIPGRGQVVTNRLLIESGSVRQVMYYFFVTRMGIVASEYILKLELAKAALSFQSRDAMFIRVSAPVMPNDQGDSADRALDLLVKGMPLLSKGMPF